MRLAAFSVSNEDRVRLGAVIDETIVELPAGEGAVDPILDLLREAGGLDRVRALIARRRGTGAVYSMSQVRLYAPVRQPGSLRDFYAFEGHVRAARANRGLDVPPAWYEIAVFYFSNHRAIVDPFAEVKHPKASHALDFELEIAAVIGQTGIDIAAREAEGYIAGYMVMNDWSARDLQRREMKLNLGPAKGKDFATTLGPYLVTPDELLDRRIDRGAAGCVYDLEMIGRVNGREVSRGSWRDMHFTFAQLIERASQDVWLYPGDVIGSGTVGTGCLLELTKGQGPWLRPGDVVELEIERLGVIRNRVRG